MIHLALPFIPPTTNHAYLNNKGGGRRLAPEAERFLLDATTHLTRYHRAEMLFFTTRKDTPLTVAARVTMRELENKTWAKKEGVARYKQTDTTNRIKLLEDALATAAGVDDSQNITIALQKTQGPKEKTDLWVWDPEREDSPLDRVFRELVG